MLVKLTGVGGTVEAGAETVSSATHKIATLNFQFGCPGSNFSRDHYSMRLHRGTGLIRAFIPPGFSTPVLVVNPE